MSSASASPELEEEPYVDRKPRWATEPTPTTGDLRATSKFKITIRDPQDHEFILYAGRSSKWSKIKAVYASKKRADPAAFHLTYDGQRVDLTGRTTVGDSLEDEELEEGVVVDVVLAQVGGGVRGLGGETICDS